MKDKKALINRIITIAGCILTAALIVSGVCADRARITNSAFADAVIEDADGSKQQDYEDRRESMNLTPVKAIPAAPKEALKNEQPEENKINREEEKDEKEKREEKTEEKIKADKENENIIEEKQEEKKETTQQNNTQQNQNTSTSSSTTKTNTSSSNTTSEKKKSSKKKANKKKSNKKKSEKKSSGKNNSDNGSRDNNGSGEGNASSGEGSSSGNGSTDSDNGSGGNSSGGNGSGSGGNGSGSGEGTGQAPNPEADVTVKFDPNGGTCDTSSMKRSSAGTYGDLPVPSREGYMFDGWFTDKDEGEGIHITPETPLLSDTTHTLYAHWTEITQDAYTITFDPCGGRMKTRDMHRTLQIGAAYGQMPSVVNSGYDFDGWYTEPEPDPDTDPDTNTDQEGGTLVTAEDIFTLRADQTLYAHWTLDPYKYWSSKRQEIYESMYACQVVDCYIEFEDNETAVTVSLLDDSKVGNCARNRGSNTTVTDEWVEERNPYAIIKCTDQDPVQALDAMYARFPDRRILIVPTSAVSGTDSEQLYYTMYLGKIIYPTWFEEADLTRMSEELGVSGDIYE